MKKGTKRKNLGENKNEKWRKISGRDGEKLDINKKLGQGELLVLGPGIKKEYSL